MKLTQKMSFYVIFADFKSFLLIIFTISLGHQNLGPGDKASSCQTIKDIFPIFTLLLSSIIGIQILIRILYKDYFYFIVSTI
jgi:hypothetical protein